MSQLAIYILASATLGMGTGVIIGIFLSSKRRYIAEAQRAQRERDLQKLQKETEVLREEHTASIRDVAAFKAQLAAKEEYFLNAKEHMQHEFKNLSQQLLEHNLQKNNVEIGRLMNPVKERIVEFGEKLQKQYEAGLKERASLSQELSQLRTLNAQISKEAHELSGALRSNTQKQGAWGEAILERVLEIAGLQKGRNFAVQVSRGNVRLDAVIYLPEHREIVIDSKVSLEPYTALAQAEHEHRDTAKKGFYDAVLTHIKALSSKRYHESATQGEGALDYVIMFFPIEAAFPHIVSTHGERGSLYEEGLRHNIIITCPTTLIPILRCIDLMWKYDQQSKNVEDTIKLIKNLYEKFASFSESFVHIGTALDKANSTYDEAKNRLLSGRGNITRQMDHIREYSGLSSSKHIAQTLLDDAQ